MLICYWLLPICQYFQILLQFEFASIDKITKYRQYRHGNCLPITDMPIWIKSANIADVEIIIGTALASFEGYRILFPNLLWNDRQHDQTSEGTWIRHVRHSWSTHCSAIWRKRLRPRINNPRIPVCSATQYRTKQSWCDNILSHTQIDSNFIERAGPSRHLDPWSGQTLILLDQFSAMSRYATNKYPGLTCGLT